MAIVNSLNDLGRIMGTRGKKSQPIKKIVNGLRTLGTKKNNAQISTATYEVLREVNNVLVKVPKESSFMERRPTFVASNGDTIPAYWQNGKPLKGGIFLNVNFFGINKNDFGKNVIARVKVIKKVMSDGREFIMLDVTSTPGIAPEYDLKFPEGNNGGISILGTNQEIQFRQRVAKK